MNAKKTLDDLNFKGQKVLVRVDFNVPIANGVVQSNKRIIAALPTIKKITSEGGKVILMSHLGRVKKASDKQLYSLLPVAKVLEKVLNKKVKFIAATRSPSLETAINQLRAGEILMFENTRFEDLKARAESTNKLELAAYWAGLGDIFVNDAFGTAHRSHASNVGIASHIKQSAIGYLVEQELKMLSQGLTNPQKPFVAIIGGAKVSDKIAIIEHLLTKADKILIGGAMAYTFLKAKGYEVGKSLLEAEHLGLAKKFLAAYPRQIVLPIDHAYAHAYQDLPRQISKNQNLPPHGIGLDIGPQTIALFKQQLEGAKTVVWNGPMGVAEFENFKIGTEAIARMIASQAHLFSIIGGGDSAAAAIKLGFESAFTHISTGGGASLQYMEGKPLPGVEAIANK